MRRVFPRDSARPEEEDLAVLLPDVDRLALVPERVLPPALVPSLVLTPEVSLSLEPDALRDLLLAVRFRSSLVLPPPGSSSLPLRRLSVFLFFSLLADEESSSLLLDEESPSLLLDEESSSLLLFGEGSFLAAAFLRSLL